MLGSLIAGIVSINPTDTSSLIGFQTLQHVSNAVAGFALLGCAVAAVVGGARWAFGAGSTNVVEQAAGKKMVAGGVVGAVIIGAAATIINFAYTSGTQLH